MSHTIICTHVAHNRHIMRKMRFLCLLCAHHHLLGVCTCMKVRATLKEAYFFVWNRHFLKIFLFLQKIEMKLQRRVFVVKTIRTRRWKAETLLSEIVQPLSMCTYQAHHYTHQAHTRHKKYRKLRFLAYICDVPDVCRYFQCSYKFYSCLKWIKS